jgi:hypothetical protein
MHVHTWVQGLDLALVCCEVRVGIITDVDSFGAVVSKLVSAGAANSIGRVGSYIDIIVVSSEKPLREPAKLTGDNYHLVLCPAIPRLALMWPSREYLNL